MAAEYSEWPLINSNPAEGMEIAGEFSTTIVTSISGIEQRRAKWSLPRHRIKLRFDKTINDSTEVEAAYNFYLQMQGAYGKFAIFDYDDIREWGPITFGTANGSTDSFYLPCHESVDDNTIVITVANSTKVMGANPAGDYTLSSGGTDGNHRKKITFNATKIPTTNQIMTVTFTGRRFFVARFATDQLSYQVFASMLYTIGVELYEVKGE